MNYKQKVTKAIELGIIDKGSVVHFDVAHDNWCKYLKNKGECNCNPDITFEKDGDLLRLRDNGLLEKVY